MVCSGTSVRLVSHELFALFPELHDHVKILLSIARLVCHRAAPYLRLEIASQFHCSGSAPLFELELCDVNNVVVRVVSHYF